MTVCPIAVAVGCRRCPVFTVCPLKTVIGDQPPASTPQEAAPPRAKSAAKSRKRKS